ncbi:MAG: hypothetical protein AAGA64_17055 [Bacteroidota bacterium]
MLVKKAAWENMIEVLDTFSKARPVSEERVIFNIEE